MTRALALVSGSSCCLLEVEGCGPSLVPGLGLGRRLRALRHMGSPVRLRVATPLLAGGEGDGGVDLVSVDPVNHACCATVVRL